MMASHHWDAACFLSRRELRGAVPGQEVVDPVDRMIGDAGQDMAQPSLGVNTVELGRADQRVDGSGTPLKLARWVCGWMPLRSGV